MNRTGFVRETDAAQTPAAAGNDISETASAPSPAPPAQAEKIKLDEMSAEAQDIRTVRNKALLSRDKDAIIDPVSGRTIGEARKRHAVASKLHVARRGTGRTGQVTEAEIDAAIEAGRAGAKPKLIIQKESKNNDQQSGLRQPANRGQRRRGKCKDCP